MSVINPNIEKGTLLDWWESLEEQWKLAYSQVCYRSADIVEPKEEDLEKLIQSPAMRFAGPKAPYSNMNFELTNLSGLSEQSIPTLETLVFINHAISHIDELDKFTQLTSLFLYENQIKNIDGIRNIRNLKELYIHSNQIESLKALTRLTQLHTINCQENLISNFEGITEEHSDALENFHCLPNNNLTRKQIMKLERELYIYCKKS